MAQWTPTKENLPDEDTECLVITEGGEEHELVFWHNLWFVPDKSMYVYYTPVFWQSIE
jgi:hypothetical protein